MSLIEVNLKCAKCIDTGQNLSDKDEWVEAVKRNAWNSEEWSFMITAGPHRGKMVVAHVTDTRKSIPELLIKIKEEAISLYNLISMNADRLQEKTNIPVTELLTLLELTEGAKENVV